MRDLNHLNMHRFTLRGQYGDAYNGAFLIPHYNERSGLKFNVIAGSGLGWDHVSVSLQTRAPNWAEMCYIKDLFFEKDEVAIQYHPAETNYVNVHPFCLHLWRPHDVAIPMPPLMMV